MASATGTAAIGIAIVTAVARATVVATGAMCDVTAVAAMKYVVMSRAVTKSASRARPRNSSSNSNVDRGTTRVAVAMASSRTVASAGRKASSRVNRSSRLRRPPGPSSRRAANSHRRLSVRTSLLRRPHRLRVTRVRVRKGSQEARMAHGPIGPKVNADRGARGAVVVVVAVTAAKASQVANSVVKAKRRHRATPVNRGRSISIATVESARRCRPLSGR